MLLGNCKDAAMQYRLQTFSNQVKLKIITKLKQDLFVDETLLQVIALIQPFIFLTKLLYVDNQYHFIGFKVLLSSIEFMDEDELVEAISLVIGLPKDNDSLRAV